MKMDNPSLSPLNLRGMMGVTVRKPVSFRVEQLRKSLKTRDVTE
jgi:uncharacterized protein YneF (UPF0154 family)